MAVKTEAELAEAAVDALAHGRVVVLPEQQGDDPVELPKSAVRALSEVLELTRRGESARVITDDEEVTTQQAAEILNVSRPYLVGLVDKGELPARKVGTRRRLKLADVLLYREVQHARQMEAADALTAEAQELGIY